MACTLPAALLVFFAAHAASQPPALEERHRGPGWSVFDDVRSATGLVNPSPPPTTTTIEVDERGRNLVCGSYSLADLAKTGCKSSCPLVKLGTRHPCEGFCLTEEQCKAHDGFPNATVGACAGCQVHGCQKCDGDKDTCAQCHWGLRKKQDGSCGVPGLSLFTYITLVFVVVFLITAIYIGALLTRKVVNKHVLQEALKERELSKLRDESRQGMPLYPWHTLMAAEPVAGRGVLLYFRHMLALLIWCIGVTVVLSFIASYYGMERPGPISEVHFCQEEDYLHDEDMTENRVMLQFSFIVWVGSTLGSLVLVVWQRMHYAELDSGGIDMQDFALMAKGFPKEVPSTDGKPLEQEIREFFQGILGKKIVGVSVCWNFHEEHEKVMDTMARELARLEWGDGFNDRLKSEKRPSLAGVDDVICGISVTESDSEDVGSKKGKKSSRKVGAELATKFASTGHVVVVFHSMDDVEKIIDLFKKQPTKKKSKKEKFAGRELSSPTFDVGQRRKFRGCYDIYLQHIPCGPGELKWENFGKRWAKVSQDMTFGAVQVFGTMALWLICFYGPYAWFMLCATSLNGSEMDVMVNSTKACVLGLLIVVGNRLVYRVIAVVAERAGFYYATMTDNLNMTLYTISAVTQMCLDLLTVIWLSKGEQAATDFASDDWQEKLLSTKRPSRPEAWSNQLFGYLFPSTILGPYMAEGIAYFAFEWLNMMVVRSRPGLGIKHAQEILALDQFDFSHYADNVINISIVILFLFYTSHVMFPAFLSLVASLVYIYVWDSYRVLRCTREHEMDLDHAESTAQFLLVMPCSLLAAGTVFHCGRMGAFDAAFVTPGSGEKAPVLMLTGVAALVHAVLHIGLIWIMQVNISNEKQEEEEEDGLFEELCEEQALTWFNSNPMHCLRSKYVFGDNPPCIYCVKGKERLLKVNKEIGCYFDGPSLSRSIEQTEILNEEELRFLGLESSKTRKGKKQRAHAYTFDGGKTVIHHDERKAEE